MLKQKATHYKTKNKKKRKQVEFSKKWLIACIVISLFYTSLSYVLAWFDKNTVEGLSTTIIDTLWGTAGVSFIGYVLQNSIRAYTSSRFGIPNTEIDNEEGENDDDNR